MGILIGMDEAGYGPKLGPLVVAATAWQIAEEVSGVRCQVSNGEPASAGGRSSANLALLNRPITLRNPQSRVRLGYCNPQSHTPPDLYRLLRPVVAKSPSDRHVPIADSKALYNPATGLRHLERGLHSVLLAMQQQPSCWSSLVQYCQADPDSHHRRACWPGSFNCPLPLHADANDLTRLSARFSRACEAVGAQPLFIRARLVFPAQFNDLISRFGNKATALSHITIGLLREVVDAVPPQSPAPSPHPPIHAVCDKHGGRNSYTALLQHHFSEHWISPTFESHAESHYAWGPPESPVHVCFRMNGETFLPTALASMTAKYLRELSMKAFNEFWSAHIPNLRPTAGYSTDARRFKRAIESKQRELKIDDHLIWRNR